MQATGPKGGSALQKLQKSVSAKAAPLLALAGIAPVSPQDSSASHELLPLKEVLRRELQLQSLPSGSQSLEPLFKAGAQKHKEGKLQLRWIRVQHLRL